MKKKHNNHNHDIRNIALGLIAVLALIGILGVSRSSIATCVDPSAPQGGFTLTTYEYEDESDTGGADTRLTTINGTKIKAFFTAPDPALYQNTCGWPMIYLIPGSSPANQGGIDGSPIRTLSAALAKQGFAVASANNFGMGLDADPAAMTDLWGPIDTAHHAFLVNEFSGLTNINGLPDLNIDDVRLGIYGASAGGTMAIKFADASGRTLVTSQYFSPGGTPTPQYTVIAPNIAVVAPRTSSVDMGQIMAPDRLSFNAFSAQFGGAIVNQNLKNDITASFLNVPQKPDALHDFFAGLPSSAGSPFTTQPERNINKSNWTVPVCAANLYFDMAIDMASALDSWNNFPQTVPVTRLLTTGGHGSVVNTIEDQRYETYLLKCFNQFLKGQNTGILNFPFDYRVIPDDPDYINSAFQWKRLIGNSIGNNTTAVRYYMTKSGDLARTKWNGSPSADDLPMSHTPLAGAIPSDFLLNPSISFVQSNFDYNGKLGADPVSYPALKYTTTKNVSGTLSGRIKVHVAMQSQTATPFMVAAYGSKIDSSGSEHPIANGYKAVTPNFAGEEIQFDIFLGDATKEFFAGNKFRLELDSIPITRRATSDDLKAAPFFNAFQLNLHHYQSPIAVSYVELPMRTVGQANLYDSTQDN